MPTLVPPSLPPSLPPCLSTSTLFQFHNNIPSLSLASPIVFSGGYVDAGTVLPADTWRFSLQVLHSPGLWAYQSGIVYFILFYFILLYCFSCFLLVNWFFTSGTNENTGKARGRMRNIQHTAKGGANNATEGRCIYYLLFYCFFFLFSVSVSVSISISVITCVSYSCYLMYDRW